MKGKSNNGTKVIYLTGKILNYNSDQGFSLNSVSKSHFCLSFLLKKLNFFYHSKKNWSNLSYLDIGVVFPFQLIGFEAVRLGAVVSK